jgi:predicted SAM-dependent methyltransferase
MKTAVEWLVEHLTEYGVDLSHHELEIEQAKEMEKSQQERMYSEEDVYHILCEHTAFLFAGGKSTLSEWFEKFKKK